MGSGLRVSGGGLARGDAEKEMKNVRPEGLELRNKPDTNPATPHLALGSDWSVL